MVSVTATLDDIASALESKGYLRDAYEVDLVANTIEAYEKDAFDLGGALKNGLAYLKNKVQGGVSRIKAVVSGMASRAQQASAKHINENIRSNDRAKKLGSILAGRAKQVAQAQGALAQSKAAAEGDAPVPAPKAMTLQDLKAELKRLDPKVFTELVSEILGSYGMGIVEGLEEAVNVKLPPTAKEFWKKAIIGFLASTAIMIPFGALDNGLMFYIGQSVETLLHSVFPWATQELVDSYGNTGSDVAGVFATIPIAVLLRKLKITEGTGMAGVLGSAFGVGVGCLLGSVPAMIAAAKGSGVMASDESELS